MGEAHGFIDIVFDGPPEHEAGRFVEVENEKGASISFGEWVQREDGYWCLRIPVPACLIAAAPDLLKATERAIYLLTGHLGAPDDWEELVPLRAVIQKAKGER